MSSSGGNGPGDLTAYLPKADAAAIYESIADAAALLTTADAAKTYGRLLHPESDGAVGDGVADDSAALATTLSKLRAGDTLLLAEGRTYTHSDVIEITTPAVRLVGGGTLKATTETASAVVISADEVVVDGVKSSCATTGRGTELHEQAWALNGCAGVILRRVRVDGSRTGGIFAYGAADYWLDKCQVANTEADGYHHTHGSTRGIVTFCRATNPGDDGHAVVSYDVDPVVCSDITCLGFILRGQSFGRGMTVVGGQSVHYEAFQVYDSFSAALYVAVEAAERSISDVTVARGLVVRPNQGWAGGTQLGGIVIDNIHAINTLDKVAITDVEIRDAGDSIGTGAGYVISLRHNGAGPIGPDVRVERIRVRGSRPTDVVTNPAGLVDAIRGVDVGPLTATKAADTSRTNTAVPVVDPDLVVDQVAANSVYRLDGLLIYDTTQTGDLKLTATFPSGTLTWWAEGPAQTNASTAPNEPAQFGGSSMARDANSGGGTAIVTGGVATANGTVIAARLRGLLRVGPTGGAFGLNWSQGTADASNVVLKADSHLTLTPIE